MKFIKNTELAEIYKVSEDTITNWVKSAKKKKINLELVEEGKRTYIANNPTNHLVLKDLSMRGKKYKNRKSLKVVSPKPEFYEIFDRDQIIDIIMNLEVFKEIDLKYIYFKNGDDFDGAVYWDDYFNRSLKEELGNTPKNTIDLLDSNLNYLLSRISEFEAVNVIDIGVGNAMPVKRLLEEFRAKGILKKYIAIDYSPAMLEFAKQNIKNWFGDDFPVEYHQRDFTYEGVRDLLFMNSQSERKQKKVLNLILFIGSTIENQREYERALRIIKGSMGTDDLLVLGQTMDSDTSKLILHFDYQKQIKDRRTELFFFIPDLLNLDPSFYEVERVFSEKENARIIRLSMKTNVDICFETPSFKRTIELNSREKILIWRHNHHSFTDLVNRTATLGFDILHATTSRDYGNMMIVARVEKPKQFI